MDNPNQESLEEHVEENNHNFILSGCGALWCAVTTWLLSTFILSNIYDDQYNARLDTAATNNNCSYGNEVFSPDETSALIRCNYTGTPPIVSNLTFFCNSNITGAEQDALCAETVATINELHLMYWIPQPIIFTLALAFSIGVAIVYQKRKDEINDGPVFDRRNYQQIP